MRSHGPFSFECLSERAIGLRPRSKWPMHAVTPVAQWLERAPAKGKVVGSIPTGGTLAFKLF